ncbi:MAG: hypothetical protein N2246_03100, partial [Candidatus Sumerlaeia bacterium]|nr:hypothetical protein [Candidatus Sumerlaeia bacterium]
LGDYKIRLLPPLIIEETHCQCAIEIISRCLKETGE